MKFAYIQTLFIIFLLFLVFFAYENDPNFETDLKDTLSHYYSQMALIAIGTTGLVLSISWLLVNHRRDSKSMAVRGLIPQQASAKPPQPETHKPGMLRRVLSELRPYMLS